MALRYPVILLHLLLVSVHSLSCLDESGNQVDWFMILKFPHGFSYIYSDPNTNWTISQNSLGDSSRGSVAATLSQAYTSNDIGFVVYNDEPPSGEDKSSRGHAKGVLAWDSSSSFWMIHSAPKFPDAIPGSYSGLHSSESTYGQSFLCISMANADDAGQLLETTYPSIYSQQASSDMSSLPFLSRLLANKFNTSSSAAQFVPFKSSGGQAFLGFSKDTKWDADLFEDIVAPTLKSDFMVETWCRSPCLPTYCKPSFNYDVINVQTMTVPGGATWDRSEDHSKWGIGVQKKYVCIGDINRMQSQRKRGGGTVCLNAPVQWEGINSFITAADKCSSNN